MLADFAVKVRFDGKAGVEVELIADDRADGAEGVKALGAGPLIVLFLEVASGDIIGEGEAAYDVAPVGIGLEVACAAADDDGELAFKVDALRDGRHADDTAGSEQRRGRLKKDQRLRRHLVAELADVGAIVAADADDFGRRDGRKEFGGGEGHGREGGRGAGSLQFVGEIFLGRGSGAGDPKLTVAIFDGAVVSLAIRVKATILHVKTASSGRFLFRSRPGIASDA